MRQQAATDLAVPVVDTDGRHLRLSTSSTDHVAVASLAIPVHGSVAHLDVLAASHRVRIVAPSGATVVETVACDTTAGYPSQLPVDTSWVAGERAMDFSSQILQGDPAVSAAADAIASLDSARSIVVRFPGHQMAFTAIELLPPTTADVISWRTWHLYPGADAHVVTTSTTSVRCTAARPNAARPNAIPADDLPSVDLPSVDLPSVDLQGVS